MTLDARGVAFVTGASSGLGRGLATRLAGEGWSVGLAARRAGKLDDAVCEIAEAGGVARAYPCDVSVREEVDGAVARCVEDLGPVDLLVANAGVSELTPGGALDAAEVERVMRINFLGAVYPTESVLPGMLERARGHIVPIGSLAGYSGLPQSGAYSASKAALHNFFESLRIDLRGTGVDVTVVTPGFVDTPLTRRNAHPMPFLMDLDEGVEAIHRAIRKRKPLAAFPWPLAAAVWFAQILPSGLYDRLASRVDRDKRPAQESSPEVG